MARQERLHAVLSRTFELLDSRSKRPLNRTAPSAAETVAPLLCGENLRQGLSKLRTGVLNLPDHRGLFGAKPFGNHRSKILPCFAPSSYPFKNQRLGREGAR